MNGNLSNPPFALQHFEPMSGGSYPIEAVVNITQTPRHLIAVYCRHGLIAPVGSPEREGWRFDDEAIRELRQLQRLRDEFELDVAALRLVVSLHREVDRLRAEVRFLQGR